MSHPQTLKALCPGRVIVTDVYLQETVMSHPQTLKALSPGRVIVTDVYLQKTVMSHLQTLKALSPGRVIVTDVYLQETVMSHAQTLKALSPGRVIVTDVYLQKTVMSHPQTLKALCPGRVIVTDTPEHHNVLGVVLASGRDRTYTVLIVCGQDESTEKDIDQCDLSTPRPLVANQLYLPEGLCGHRVVILKTQISSVTTSTIKVNGDKIINDYNKRQQPRFR